MDDVAGPAKRPVADADVHPDARRRLGVEPPTDVHMRPSQVTVVLDGGGGHCLYYALVQALSAQGELSSVDAMRDVLDTLGECLAP